MGVRHTTESEQTGCRGTVTERPFLSPCEFNEDFKTITVFRVHQILLERDRE